MHKTLITSKNSYCKKFSWKKGHQIIRLHNYENRINRSMEIKNTDNHAQAWQTKWCCADDGAERHLGDPEDDSRCAEAKQTAKAEYQAEQRANPAPRLSERGRRRVYIVQGYTIRFSSGYNRQILQQCIINNPYVTFSSLSYQN